jgi:hypothetical protein
MANVLRHDLTIFYLCSPLFWHFSHFILLMASAFKLKSVVFFSIYLQLSIFIHNMFQPNLPCSGVKLGFAMQVFERQLLLSWFLYVYTVQPCTCSVSTVFGFRIYYCCSVRQSWMCLFC